MKWVGNALWFVAITRFLGLVWTQNLTRKKSFWQSSFGKYGPLGPLLLGQGEKVIATSSGPEMKSGSSATGGKRKPRDFEPSGTGRNVNKNRHADTFKPSPAKSSDDSFKPVVQTPKSEKIVLKNTILASQEQIPSLKDTELIPESSIRPATSPPSPSSSTTSLLTTLTSAF